MALEKGCLHLLARRACARTVTTDDTPTRHPTHPRSNTMNTNTTPTWCDATTADACTCPPARVTPTPDGSGVDLSMRLHRIDGPAVEVGDSYRAWYQHDRLHRTDGPAIESGASGATWHLHGKAVPATTVIDTWLTHHRPDAPAAVRDQLLDLANNWPMGANLADLHAATVAATA